MSFSRTKQGEFLLTKFLFFKIQAKLEHFAFFFFIKEGRRILGRLWEFFFGPLAEAI
jgi:hypothetical protein